MSKTDNSYLFDKIVLRKQCIEEKKLKKVKIIDAYHGEGKIWNRINIDKEILSIDKKANASIKTDNRKLFENLDLDSFDIIDLDAYGMPIDILEILFKKRYTGLIFITFIQVMNGIISKKLLTKLGYSDKMIGKIKSIFNKNGFDKLKNYLALNGVTKIVYKQTENKRKNYIGIMEVNYDDNIRTKRQGSGIRGTSTELL